jgi:hypothetical protein
VAALVPNAEVHHIAHYLSFSRSINFCNFS